LYCAVLRDARFFSLLLRIDREIAAEARSRGCRLCGGPLHAGHFCRKPRGVVLGAEHLPEGYDVRFDFCCGRCRRRTLPESVRFLGRKVYLGVVVAIATVVRRGPDRAAMLRLRRELGVSRATVARWVHWWGELTGSAFWQRLRGTLPPDLDLASLPTSLLDALAGDPAKRLERLLRLMGPMTGSVPVALASSP
jgi:hypothetical protein